MKYILTIFKSGAQVKQERNLTLQQANDELRGYVCDELTMSGGSVTDSFVTRFFNSSDNDSFTIVAQ